MRSPTRSTSQLGPATHLRPRPLLAALAALAAALAVAGCTARAATPSSAAPPTTAAPPAASAPATTRAPAAHPTVPARARCALDPRSGPAGSTTTLTCGGFAPSERVAVRFGAVVLTRTRAGGAGAVSASLQVPDGFAGSHYPGRRDTLEVEGGRSGRLAAATFTVTG